MDQSDITISVSDPVTKESGLTKYVAYLVKGSDTNGNFEVFRRFSDFFTLRETLVAKFPACIIPSIPDK